MGLDMYLTKETYVKRWEHQTDADLHEVSVKKGGEAHPTIQTNRISGVVEEVMYWRKANAIHGWFVDNCQDGIDDCQRTHVSVEQLKELRDLCQRVILDKQPELLPPREGFFFGSKEVDDWYYSDLADTVAQLDKELDGKGDEYGVDYYYRSSW
tara:strand:- start:582 stop:1043 length:462 start_codon:yes stop_codon:yes gene_type:complete